MDEERFGQDLKRLMVGYDLDMLVVVYRDGEKLCTRGLGTDCVSGAAARKIGQLIHKCLGDGRAEVMEAMQQAARSMAEDN